jgi:hypothetical protein
MNIIYAIPSGQRSGKLLDCIAKWRKVCNFKIAVTTWDDDTENMMKIAKPDYFFRTIKRESFSVNHNRMAKDIPGWDVYICGADDLYPDINMNLIESVAVQCPDKVIWVKDGLFDQQMTHPIITKGWYQKYQYIFDENYIHNFTDTDLLIRVSLAQEVVKCFQIGFDHRHFLKTNRKPDEIYQIGNKSYSEDQKYFKQKFKHVKPKFEIQTVEVQ